MADGRRQKATKEVSFPRRGEIYLVQFDPARGHEIKKTRPALIIQNNIGNQFSSVMIVAAISSKISIPPYPVEVIVETGKSGLSARSTVRLDQIRSVDKEQLVKRVGQLEQLTMNRVDEAIKVSLGLIEL